MRLYRFSPIKNKEELLNAVTYIHVVCHDLCKQTFNTHLPTAGNIAVFCHYDEEYEFLTELRKALTDASDNVDQKYFRLLDPIVIPAKGEIPETIYTYIYIRKPDPYRHHVGDVDFSMEQSEYEKVKRALLTGKALRGARVFDREDLDMIELRNPDIDVLAYISIQTTASVERALSSLVPKGI